MRTTRRTLLTTPIVLAASVPVAVAAWRSSLAESALGSLFATPSASPAASPIASPSASPAASPGATGEVEVHILDFSFEPESLEIPVGTTVTWINHGETIHNTVADDDTWMSEVLDPGESFSATLMEPGTYPYICSIHPTMEAVLTVVG